MSCYFMAPALTQLESIRLKYPIFGDQYLVNLQVTVGHSRSGDRYAYKRTPTYQTLKLEFHDIPLADRINISGMYTIKAFFDKYAATEIAYIYTKNNVITRWKGIVLNNPEFTNEGKDGCSDLYSFMVEFEGERF